MALSNVATVKPIFSLQQWCLGCLVDGGAAPHFKIVLGSHKYHQYEDVKVWLMAAATPSLNF
eukprot:11516697-Ditylum_brightwellii.AAC.1